MWNYFLPIGTAFIAVLQLTKDWGGHQTHWRRGLLLGLIVVLAIGGAVNNYITNRRSAAQHAQDQAEIGSLKKAVETANQNQTANTKQFLEAFGKLGKEMSDLQAQVKTEGLQKKLAQMQTELQNTQKALAPASKAKLAFSFFPFDLGSIGVRPPSLSKDVTVAANADDTIDVEIAVLNVTEVDALDGEYAILICDDCKYAKEPSGFVKGEGRPDKERYMSFSRIGAKSQFGFVKLSLETPPKFANVPIGIMYRCRTCEVPPSMDDLMGTVHVIRSFPLFPNKPPAR